VQQEQVQSAARDEALLIANSEAQARKPAYVSAPIASPTSRPAFGAGRELALTVATGLADRTLGLALGSLRVSLAARTASFDERLIVAR
jgi:hypothetical protein